MFTFFILFNGSFLIVNGEESEAKESETTLSDSVRTEGPTEAEPKQAQVTLEHYGEILEYSFQNDAFKQAWDSLNRILEQVTIADQFSDKLDGTTLEEFEKLNLINAEFEDGDFGQDSMLRMYTFKTDGPFSKEVSEDPGTANLVLLFKEKVLVYIGVSNNSFLFTSESLLQVSEVEAVAKEPFEYQQIAVKDPIILSFGMTKVKNNTYQVISLPSGTPEAIGVEYFAILDNQFDYVTTKSIGDVIENGLNETIDALNRYIVEYSGEFYQIKAPVTSNKDEE